MTSHIQAGVAATTITPPLGTLMMGFGARDHGAEGVLDDLHARALWLRGPATGASTRSEADLLLLSVEVSAFSVDEANVLKELLAARYALPAANVLINNTHTHAGPLVAPRLYAMGEGAAMEPDPLYLATLRQAVVDVVGAARDALKPARLAVGTGDCRVGIGRRLPTEAGFTMAPNPEQPINTDSMVLYVQEDDNGVPGDPIAILFSVNCHPTVMGADNYHISAEFPGVACRLLEERYPGATALFLQGATGEIKARQVADMEARRFRKGSYADVQAVGQDVARDIETVLAGELMPVTGPLQGEAAVVSLPFSRFDNPRALYQAVLAGDETRFRPQWATYHLRELDKGRPQPEAIDCPVQMVRLGEMTIMAFGGELCSLHAQHVNDALGGRNFTMGYSNGLIGYLPTDQMLDEGGYESITSISGSTALHAPLAKGIDERLLNAARELYSRS